MRKNFCALSLLLLGLLPVIATSTTIPSVIFNTRNQTQQQSSKSANTNVVTAKQIKASGARTLAQVLQGQGGIQIQDLTGSGANVSISMRGFGENASTNSLILVNGIPINNTDLSTPDLNQIPLQNIAKIIITTGSKSVLYGNQAVGGVINIITKKPLKHNLLANVSYGSYNQHDLFTNIQNIYKNGVSYRVNARTFHTDNYREHNQDNQNDIAGNVNYDYHTGHIAVNYNFHQDHLQYAGALTRSQVNANRRQAQNTTNFNNANSSFFTISQTQVINQCWSVKTHLSNRYYAGHGFLFSPFKQRRTATILNPEIIGLISTAIIKTGIDLSDAGYQLIGTQSAAKENQNSESLYTHITMPITSTIQIVAGTRVAELQSHLQNNVNLNNSNHAFVTTIGSIFHLSRTIKIFISRAGNYRFPKADENTLTPVNVKGLKTQTGVSYETGITYSHNRFDMNVNLYQLDLNNEIVFDPTQTPTQPLGANRNLPPTKRLGAILNSSYQLNSHLTLGCSYAYVHARFNSGLNQGKHIPFVAANIWHLYSNYHFHSYWNLYSEAVFTGSRFAANDDANKAEKIPAYVIFNLNLRFSRKHFFANFRLNNMFNTYYNAYVSFSASKQREFFYPAPGRSFVLTVGYRLS